MLPYYSMHNLHLKNINKDCHSREVVLCSGELFCLKTSKEYQPLISYMLCKYLFPFQRLPFHFVYCFLCYAKAFYLDVVPLCLFLLLFLVLLVSYVRNHCQDQCHGFTLFSSWSFTVSGLMFTSLVHCELIFVCGVR